MLHLGPWLLQKRCPFSKRDSANTMLSKTQVYCIYAPKCPKSIGLLLGQALMSLLKIWSSDGPAKGGNQVKSPGTGSLLWRATLRHLKELANSELGTEASKGGGTSLLQPALMPKPNLNWAVGPISRASSQVRPATAARCQPCTFAGPRGLSLHILKSKKHPTGSEAKLQTYWEY